MAARSGFEARVRGRGSPLVHRARRSPGAPRRREPEGDRVEIGEGHDLDPGPQRAAGEAPVGDDEVRVGHREQQLVDRLDARDRRAARRRRSAPRPRRATRAAPTARPAAGSGPASPASRRWPPTGAGQAGRSAGGAGATTRAGRSRRGPGRRGGPRRAPGRARRAGRRGGGRDRSTPSARRCPSPTPRTRSARSSARSTPVEAVEPEQRGGSPPTTRRITESSSVRPSRSWRPATRAFTTRDAGSVRRGSRCTRRTGAGSSRGGRDAARLLIGSLTGDWPSSRERSVAAVTASRSAPRIEPCSSARSPAAVVPPGDVTAARSASGPSSLSTSSAPAPRIVCCDERRRDVARQAVQHAAFDERLGQQEHVGRPRAREARDRVEHLLGHADHDADRAEQPLGLLEVRLGRVRAGRDRRRAPADQRGRVRHRPDHRAPGRRGLELGDRDRRRRSRAPACARRATAPRLRARRKRAAASPRRSRRRRRATAHAGLGTTRTPGWSVFEDVATVGIDLGDGERVGLEVGVEQPGDERLAHAPTTEQRDANHAARVPARVARNSAFTVCGRVLRVNAGGPEERSAASHFPERSGVLHLGPHPAGTRRCRPGSP